MSIGNLRSEGNKIIINRAFRLAAVIQFVAASLLSVKGGTMGSAAPTPAEMIDAIYKPGQNPQGSNPAPIKMDVSGEPWAKMSLDAFLPCFDTYGQFKWRDWPGKTKTDGDLKRAAAEEADDLAAHPGPADLDCFGGWSAGPRLKATGRFRTHRDERGKWWLVDPDGRLFWSFGPVRVSASSGMTPMNGDNSTPRTGIAAADLAVGRERREGETGQERDAVADGDEEERLAEAEVA